MRASLAVQEPLALTGTTLKFIDAPWVGTHASTPEADISIAIVSVGKGPQENLDRESEIRTGGGAGGGNDKELLAAQDEPKEEDAGDQASAEDDTRTYVAHTYTQGTRNAAGGIVHPLTPAPHQTQIIPPSPIPNTRAAARAALAVQEPLTLAGTTLKFIDTPWVGTHAPTPEADISIAIVSVGKGPQENLDRESEIRMGGGADDDGGMELLAAQDEPQEEDQAPAEEEEEPDTVEGESEGEHEEDEEPSATEAGGPEGSNESGGTGGYDVSGGEKGACGGEVGAPLGA